MRIGGLMTVGQGTEMSGQFPKRGPGWALTRIALIRLGQIGPKPDKEVWLSLLVDDGDLTDLDITKVGQRTYRGFNEKLSQLSTEQVQPRGTVVSRTFNRSDDKGHMVVQLNPHRSTERATYVTAHLDEFIAAPPASAISFANPVLVSNITVTGASQVYAMQHSAKLAALDGLAMFLAFNIGRLGCVIQLNSWERIWTWDNAIYIASSQVNKIRDASPDRRLGIY